MLAFSPLPVRLFDDLRIEADLGACLTPAQGIALAEDLVHRSVRKAAIDKALAAARLRPRRPGAPRKAGA